MGARIIAPISAPAPEAASINPKVSGPFPIISVTMAGNRVPNPKPKNVIATENRIKSKARGCLPRY